MPNRWGEESADPRLPYKMMRLSKLSIAIVLAITIFLFSSGIGYAAETADQSMGLSPVAFFFVFVAICTVIGIVAVLGGVGGGVVFTPLMMGFTPIDSFIIRATGLVVAMAGSLIAARPFLRRGLANIKLLFFAAVPYTIFAVVGALLAGYVKASAGDFGEALIRLILGLLVIFIAFLILFGGKKVEYPEVKKVDSFTQRLGLAMAYWEESMGKVVHYKVTRSPIAILLFCGCGIISGMFGVGAGWAMVPVFNLAMLAPLKVAAASSKVLIGIGDSAAVWPYMMRGGIIPLFAVACIVGVVIGTSIGARLMFRVKAQFIRWIVILVMIGAGVKLVIDGINKL